MGQLIKMENRLNQERDWVDLCDKYAAMLYRKDQQILALTKQNEILYDEINRLQQIILGGNVQDEMPEMQPQ